MARVGASSRSRHSWPSCLTQSHSWRRPRTGRKVGRAADREAREPHPFRLSLHFAPHALTCAADQSGLVTWLAAWLQWLTTSDLGIKESISDNNHQTYYDAMLVAAAVWTGNASLGLSVLRGTLEPPPIGHVNAPLGVQACGR